MADDDRVAAARAGDESAFQALADAHRRELVVHGYRVLGSMHDAEDAVQDSLLRAWKSLATFDGRASFRTWLYKITTHECLRRLQGRPPRTLGKDDGPSRPSDPFPAPLDDSYWIEPASESALAPAAVDPESRYSARESVSLAFLAALQVLPPRQRAVLILRDVIGWEASEVADLLDLSVVAANSALQRARESLEARYRPSARVAPRATEEHRSLLRRYMEAWELGDVTALVALLQQDAAVTMPPFPTLFVGRESVAAFLSGTLFAGGARGRYRMQPTIANGQLAAASFARGPDGLFQPDGVHALWMEDAEIVRVVAFLDPRLHQRFGIPGIV